MFVNHIRSLEASSFLAGPLRVLWSPKFDYSGLPFVGILVPDSDENWAEDLQERTVAAKLSDK